MYLLIYFLLYQLIFKYTRKSVRIQIKISFFLINEYEIQMFVIVSCTSFYFYIFLCKVKGLLKP